MVSSSSSSSTSCLLASLLCLFQLILISSSSSPIPIAVPLSLSHTNSDADLYEKVWNLATTSVARARAHHHIKGSSAAATPLLPHSYGAYSISLGFGTPPQAMSLVMDTGSDLVWFPCTKRYTCRNCSFPGGTEIHSFTPKQSSSVQIVGCLNQKCGWVHRDFDPSKSCRECRSSNCTQICPPYLLTYGSGTTGGIGLTETLDLPPHKKVASFLVGCSLFSSRQPAGIAGLGRGPASLPAQLGLTKFSYCFLSRSFDDTGDSTSLILDSVSNSGGKKTAGFSYTPFATNPLKRPVYYYVGLRRISVGGKKVKIPYKHLVPDSEGNGGTIVDSGSTFTVITSAVLEPVLAAFTRQVKMYGRASGVESLTGLRPCFNVSRQHAELPELKLHFRGGAEMKLPLGNYFVRVGGGAAADDVVCLAMVSGEDMNSGPSIILGSFQMQNYNVEYDLQNDRFGFKQQTCK